MDGEYVTLGEARRRLGVSEPLIRLRIRAGELPVYVDGRDRRLRLVRVSDLDALSVPQPMAPAKGADNVAVA